MGLPWSNDDGYVAAMRHPDYPGVSSMVDRHGKTRWRLRRSGHKDVMLPGEPHDRDFDRVYQAAILGQPGEVVKMPGAASPKSLKGAYRILTVSSDWQALDLKSQTRYRQTIERILSVSVGSGREVGDGPVEELRRTHIKSILATFGHAPHMERIALLCLRKLIVVALDEEWIEVDPTYNMSRSPQTEGHKTWPLEMMERYEKKWAIGTRQRTAYAIALWLGNRVSDVARLKWSDHATKHFMDGDTLHSVEGFEIVQFKGRKRGKSLFLPMTPMLEYSLWPLNRSTETVLATERGKGYSEGSLTGMMARWCRDADIPAGYTMHGLRKALGVKMAEADASTRQMMDMLGHHDIAYAELYSREASQMRLAVQAMDKVTRIEKARQATGRK